MSTDRKQISNDEGSPATQRVLVADLVERRVYNLMQDKEDLTNRLKNKRTKNKYFRKQIEDADKELQGKAKQLEELTKQLVESNEEIHSTKASISVYVVEMEMDIEAANVRLGDAHREFEQSNLAMAAAYAQLETKIDENKLELQRSWSRSKKLEQDNKIMTQKNVDQHVQMLELDWLNRLLGDELCWYEGQEVKWKVYNMKNQNQLAKLNREILSVLHLYGELEQERANNVALREKNARLQYEVDKLKLDMEAYVQSKAGHAREFSN